MAVQMVEYKFESIYLFVDIIYQAVKSEIEFWDFDASEFIQSATTFQKKSLLHIYVESTVFNYFRRDFRKNEDCYEEDNINEWKTIFSSYNIKLDFPNCNFEDSEEGESVYEWFLINELSFRALFKKISIEVVHILFANKNFLLQFSELARKSFNIIPEALLTEKETVKRTAIPKWVKKPFSIVIMAVVYSAIKI